MADIFCIASGPSLIKSDCELIAQSGATICCVNNSWQMFEQIDYLYAGDLKWWRAYGKQVNIFVLERWTCMAAAANEFGLNLHRANGPFNSGMRAIQFVMQKGYKEIALLGYDCSIKAGSHFHGDHTFSKAQPITESKVNNWHAQFSKVACEAEAKKVNIYNCSRDTEIGCFPRRSLEDIL